MSIEFDIPSVPPSLNVQLRMHWTRKRDLRQVWKMYVRSQMRGIMIAEGKRHVEITMWHSRLYDAEDNLRGACKPIFDALTDWGLIVDDSREWITARVEQEKCPHKERHTVIRVSEAQ